MALDLVRTLVQHRYVAGVRELEALLWSSLATSEGNVLDLTADVGASLESGAESQRASIRPRDLTEADVRAALERCSGVQEKAWKELGLANRYVLKRLVKKFGIKSE